MVAWVNLKRMSFRYVLALIGLSTVAVAQPGPGPTLTYIAGSSVKVEQVIGDCDDQAQAKQIVAGQTVTCVPTTSQTVTRFDIAGNGQGGSFEDNGKMTFFFGDTISNHHAVQYNAADPVASSTSTDPTQGLLLNFYTNADGSPLFVQPPGIDMGADDIPNSGINLNGQTYLICNTGSQSSLGEGPSQATDYSVLVQFDETAQTFSGVRGISEVGGHFIGTAMYALGPNVFIFGAGPYRASDIYMQMVPAASFASGAGTQYFAGLVNGQPTWTDTEAGVVPVVQDNPLNGPPWPNDSPTVGNLSVVYSTNLNLWLMTYDGGRQSEHTRGAYFTYAQQPWGPWAAPQLIFNEVRDNGYGLGGFIHNPNVVPDPPGDGLNGPTIGMNNIYTTSGGSFAPLMIGRFLTVTGNTLKVYYNVSTWNPYTIVRMESDFTITPPPAFFNGAVSLGSGVDYLQFPDGNLFGYYNLTSFPIFYHYDMGFESFVDGGNGGAYLFDFASGHWWYTSSSLFPYLYDFTRNVWLYYFPDTNNPGHYTTNPRYFSNLKTGKIIVM
jgi:hypothetical protein